MNDNDEERGDGSMFEREFQRLANKGFEVEINRAINGYLVGETSRIRKRTRENWNVTSS